MYGSVSAFNLAILLAIWLSQRDAHTLVDSTAWLPEHVWILWFICWRLDAVVLF